MEEKVESCRSVGNKLYKEKQYSDALKHYRLGLQFDPNHPQLNYNAANAAFYLGLYDESEKYAKVAIDNKKDYDKAYYRAFKAVQSKNDFEKQLDYLVEGLENCGACESLLQEAGRMQHMVVSSFCEDSKVKEFFSQPRTAYKFHEMEELMLRARLSKSATFQSPFEAFRPDLRPNDFSSFSAMPNFVGSANCSTGITMSCSGPYAVHGKVSDNGIGSFLQMNENSKLKEEFFKNAASKPKTPAALVQTPPPQAALAKAAPLKENVGGSIERGKSLSRPVKKTTEPPARTPDKTRMTPTDKSDQRGRKKLWTDSTSDGVNSKEVKTGMSITEEIILTLKKGREAFLNSFYHQAVTYLVAAQTKLKEHSLEDVAEFVQSKVPLAYVISEAKVGCGEYKDIEEGIQILRSLIEKEESRNFPSVFYLLGLAFYKLNRFKEAREHLYKVNSRIQGGVNFTSYPWPGTFDVINSTQKTYLEAVVKDLLRECNAYHKPNWICLFEECEKISTHIIPSRKIYFNDPDFSGYVELSCCAKCSIIFHPHCWKAYKEQQEIKRLTDKDILGEPCFTPDCKTSAIVSIKIYDKDGNITHNDSIPYDAPTPKSRVKRYKLTEPSTGQKEFGVSRASHKAKPKSLNSPSNQKNTRVGKRATEEASTTGVEERDMDFEAELEVRKLKLDNMRTSDKRWQHFHIGAPDSSPWELSGEEKFVESFFEEVLKNNGPLHVCRVEDFFRENKTLLENAVPSLRTLYDLLRFLLERSHHFVLMDSVVGLAADLVDMYRLTKENINTLLKSASKASLDQCLKDMIVSSAVSDALGDNAVITGAKMDTDFGAILQSDIRAIPRANFEVAVGASSDATMATNAATDSFVPYKKTVFGPEVEKSQPVAPRPKYDEPLKHSYEGPKSDFSVTELDYKHLQKVPAPLQLSAFIKPKNLRVKGKKSTNEKKNLQEGGNDKQKLGKGKKNDAQIPVNDSCISGVLSVLMEKTIKKDVSVIDEGSSVVSSASSEKSFSVIDETELPEEDGGTQIINLTDIALSSSEPDRQKFERNSEPSETEPKPSFAQTALDIALNEKQQLSSAGTPSRTKAKLIESVNVVTSEKDQSSSAVTPPEKTIPLCESVLNLRLVSNSSGETPSETCDPVAYPVTNGKEALLSGAIVKTHTSSQNLVLHSVQSFIETAYQNCQQQLINSVVGGPPGPESSSSASSRENTSSDPSNSTPNSALTSDLDTALSGSYLTAAASISRSTSELDRQSSNKTSSAEAFPDTKEHLSSGDSSSFNSACDEVCDFVSDNVGSSLDTSFEEPVKSDSFSEDTEKCGNLNIVAQISVDDSKELSAISPRSDVPECPVLSLDIPNLPFVDPGNEDPHSPIAEPPFAPVIKDVPPKDALLFEEYPEDLFIIDDKEYPFEVVVDNFTLDLPPVDDLVWDIEDIPENGDLFTIEPAKDVERRVNDNREEYSDLFEVSRPNEFFSCCDSFKTNAEEMQQGDGLETKNRYKRWQPNQADMDYIRLSFPRQNYANLVEGLAIIFDKKGPDIAKMGSEEIVKELAEVFQLTPCLQYSDDGDGLPDNVRPETQPTQILKEDGDLNDEVTPWKPPVPLVQVVRLSFPTEEFYKLMFALYIAKLYSDTTRFDDLCDGVANVLNDINEGKCHDYNYEISSHGPYNNESRIIYEKAWRMLIDARTDTRDI